MGQLRDEIIESQKARSELLKWKLIAIAGLGAIGLSLSGSVTYHGDLVLCIIPLVTVYVDLLCSHLSLRIKVIGRYRQTRYKKKGVPGDESYLNEYEKFADDARKRGAFSMESGALIVSSLLVSAALFFAPCYRDIFIPPNTNKQAASLILPHASHIQVSGGIGFLLSIGIQIWYRFISWKIQNTPAVDGD